MIRSLESLTLFSGNARNLAEFYKEKVGLEIITEAEIGDEGEELFELDTKEGSGLYIVDHSEVKGKNQEPSRIIFNLEVSDIEEDVKRLEEAGVKKIQDIYHIENYGYIATFEDLDGNYFQLVQVRSS
ncbi:MAG: VOC family protein [Candidatus Omnitrophica bacterium]|nr:VOC family protein [Candidatus Omnitrophota bacterium]